jgi:hypothetical protein
VYYNVHVHPLPNSCANVLKVPNADGTTDRTDDAQKVYNVTTLVFWLTLVWLGGELGFSLYDIYKGKGSSIHTALSSREESGNVLLEPRDQSVGVEMKAKKRNTRSVADLNFV